jgi:putative transcriptional regulator
VKNRLRVLRAEKGWSQAELAERLNIARQSVNAIENGKADPSLPLGMRIARLFGLPVEAVFEDEVLMADGPLASLLLDGRVKPGHDG